MSVLSYLEELASFLNIAENEAVKIDRSIITLNNRIESYLSKFGLKEQFRFGSSVRKTMLPRKADPNSDVDYMVVFENAFNYKSQAFILHLKRFAEFYYSSSEIYQSSPTVVLELGHIKFDLVPSYRNAGNLYIPAPQNQFPNWIVTNPLSFNNTIEQANKNEDFRLKPMIRLLKYWNANNGYVYNSYSLEQKVVNMNFYNCNNLKDYLFSAISNLGTCDLPEYKRLKVDRARQIVINVCQCEQHRLVIGAENAIKKLLPQLW
jgi:predicted nucleotidyltransferase